MGRTSRGLKAALCAWMLFIPAVAFAQSGRSSKPDRQTELLKVFGILGAGLLLGVPYVLWRLRLAREAAEAPAPRRRQARGRDREDEDARLEKMLGSEAGFQETMAEAGAKLFTANALAGHGPERIVPKLEQLFAKHGMTRKEARVTVEALLKFTALALSEILEEQKPDDEVLATLTDQGLEEPLAQGILSGIAAAAADYEAGKKASSKAKKKRASASSDRLG